MQLLGHMVSPFLFFKRICQTIWLSGATLLHFHQRVSDPVSLHPHQHLVGSLILYLAILIGV